MNNYQKHLDREWKAMGWPTKEGEDEDDSQVWIYQHLKKLLEAFSDEGHSGSSAPYTVSLFRRLALFEPLGPLTGEDHEWNDISEYGGDTKWQNNRCSHVFKDADGAAYDSNGRVFLEPNGAAFTNSESRVSVTFPYTPIRKVVKPGWFKRLAHWWKRII